MATPKRKPRPTKQLPNFPKRRPGTVTPSPAPRPVQKHNSAPNFKRIQNCPVKRYTCISEKQALFYFNNYSKTSFNHGSECEKIGPIYQGRLFSCADGQRLVIGAGSRFVAFMRNGRYYSQDPWDFAKDVAYDPFVIAAIRSKGLVVFLKIEMALIMGIASGSGAAGFIAVTTAELGQFFAENDIKGLIKKATAIWTARKILKKTAPRLYDKIFSLRNVVKFIPQAMTELDPEDVAKFTGTLIGKLGAKAAATLIQKIGAVLLTVLIFIKTKILKQAGQVAQRTYVNLAKDVIRAFEQIQVQISEKDAQGIAKEVLANRNEIMRAVEVLQDAFGK